MRAAPIADELVKRSYVLTGEEVERLAKAAKVRKTSTNSTLRWLLDHALDWFENLPRDEREAS